MGYLFDEKQYIEENIFLHESRISSQYSRFLDKSPTFVTYYRVNNIESTTDRGFLNIERLLGSNSPIRFNEVSRLPIYGIDQIVLDLNMEEHGLDTSYEGTAIILPNTVIPRPNDFFIIDHLGSSIVFSVIGIGFDTIRSNNFYRIEYKIKAIDEGVTHDHLKKQTSDKMICYYENIGTEDKVLVRSADADIIAKLNKITTEIANYYKMLFYNNRYNSFLFNTHDGLKYYDRVLTMFINKNRLFSNRKGYDTILLADEDQAVTTPLEYHASIYKAVERREASLIKHVNIYESYVFSIESVFVRWRDRKVISVIQGMGNKYYLRPDLLDFFVTANTIFEDSNLALDSMTAADDKLNETYPDSELSVIIPDKMNKPVYVEDDNIMVKYKDIIKDESDAIGIPRNEHPYDKGIINMDKLFGGGEPKEEMELPVMGDIELPENNSVHVPSDEIEEPNRDFFPDEPTVVPESIDVKERTISYTFEIDKGIPDFLLTPEEYSNENVMVLVIAKYFSGKNISIYELDIEEISNYVSYMDMNSRETFVLVPIFLYVLEQYFMKHLEN